MKKISIIIPTYNEAENIKKLIPLLHSVIKNYDHEIIIVDDDSPDGTAKVAEDLAKKYPVRVFVRKNERGLASAILFGFKNAQGDILGVMDADLQHPPELLQKMIEKIKEGYDIVIASRYTKEGRIEKWPSYRLLISKGATLLAKPLTRVKDPMSGYFILKRSVIDDLKFDSIGYKLLLEILVKGKYKKVIEIPYTFKNRKYGRSKLNFFEILKYIHLLIRLYTYKLKKLLLNLS